jgi:hypothetical protein
VRRLTQTSKFHTVASVAGSPAAVAGAKVNRMAAQ